MLLSFILFCFCAVFYHMTTHTGHADDVYLLAQVALDSCSFSWLQIVDRKKSPPPPPPRASFLSVSLALRISLSPFLWQAYYRIGQYRRVVHVLQRYNLLEDAKDTTLRHRYLAALSLSHSHQWVECLKLVEGPLISACVCTLHPFWFWGVSYISPHPPGLLGSDPHDSRCLDQLMSSVQSGKHGPSPFCGRVSLTNWWKSFFACLGRCSPLWGSLAHDSIYYRSQCVHLSWLWDIPNYGPWCWWNYCQRWKRGQREPMLLFFFTRISWCLLWV